MGPLEPTNQASQRCGRGPCVPRRASVLVIVCIAWLGGASSAQAQSLTAEAATELEQVASTLYAEDDLSGAAAAYLELAKGSATRGQRGHFAILAAWIQHQDEKFSQRDQALTLAVEQDPDVRPEPSAFSADFLQRLQAIRINVEAERSTRAASLMDGARAAVAVNNPTEAARLYQELMALQPDRHAVRIQLAVLQLNDGDPRAAAQTLAPFKRDLAVLDPEIQQRTMSLMALARIRSGDLDGITNEIQRVTGSLQRQLWLELASSYERRERWDGAVAAYGSVLEIDPLDRRTAILRSQLLSRLGRHRDAESFLINLRETLPDSNAVWHELGIVRESMDDLLGAASAYRRAASLDPKDDVDQEGRLQALVAGARLQRKSDPVAARTAIGRALELHPERAEPLAMHGRLLSDQGRHTEAIAQVEAATALAPERIDLRNLLGNSHYLAEDYEQAIAVFEALLKEHPDLTAVRTNLELAQAASLNARVQPTSGSIQRSRTRTTPSAPTRVAQTSQQQTEPPRNTPPPRTEPQTNVSRPTSPTPGTAPASSSTLSLGLTLSPYRWAQTGRNVIRIDTVAGESKGERCGLEAGDLIIRVGGASTDTTGKVEQAMGGDTSGLRLDIVRADRPIALVCI